MTADIINFKTKVVKTSEPNFTFVKDTIELLLELSKTPTVEVYYDNNSYFIGDSKHALVWQPEAKEWVILRHAEHGNIALATFKEELQDNAAIFLVKEYIAEQLKILLGE